MDRRIAAGNWKMHGSRSFVTDYVSRLARGLSERTGGGLPRLVLFPPVGYLRELVVALDTAALSVEVGAQNVHPEPSGAYTGEMSAEMMADLGARWVLVGHSERRLHAGESDELVAAKVAAVLRAELQPMMCVGETLEERQNGQAEAVVTRQIEAVIEQVGDDAFLEGAVAYEPVWAIGTGQTATPALAEDMHRLIRSVLAKRSKRLPEDTPILYGGSVKAANAGGLFAQADIDGGLVGGASLAAEEFLAIADALR